MPEHIEPLCGDVTCQSPGCQTAALQAWKDRQWATARTVVRQAYGLPDDGLDGNAPIFAGVFDVRS